MCSKERVIWHDRAGWNSIGFEREAVFIDQGLSVGIGLGYIRLDKTQYIHICPTPAVKAAGPMKTSTSINSQSSSKRNPEQELDFCNLIMTDLLIPIGIVLDVWFTRVKQFVLQNIWSHLQTTSQKLMHWMQHKPPIYTFDWAFGDVCTYSKIVSNSSSANFPHNCNMVLKAMQHHSWRV